MLVSHPAPPTPLRLVLVDDHEMVLHGLDTMLGHFPEEVVFVGQATTAAVALRMVAEERPDVVLCDVRIGRDSGLDLCRQINTQYPGTKVVLLTVYDDEHYLYQALGRCLRLHPQTRRRARIFRAGNESAHGHGDRGRGQRHYRPAVHDHRAHRFFRMG